MKRIAFINQRYGKEVNGGSEYYTMLMAQKLKEYYNVEVLTSKALTYDRWENYYTADVEEIDGVTVRRFGVKRKRNRYVQRLLKLLVMYAGINTKRVTSMWNRALGPYVPDLINYIEEHENEYEVFIFITYMYYPTVFGMKKAAEKAVFVPTAHNEYNIYFNLYKEIFHMPRKIVYLTEEEKQFVQQLFHNEEIESHVIGAGVDIPKEVNVEKFRSNYKIENEYMIYAGRVDVNKGCEEMFEYFTKYLEDSNGDKLHLVVIGKAYMRIPDNNYIHYLGYISDEDKYAAIKAAKALLLPSENESLSIAVLEAMALRTPVIVNGKCNVLKGHCERSKSGFCYTDYCSWKTAINQVCNCSEELLANQMNAYIRKYYQWSVIIEKWISLIDSV